jgi:hypothetical protein
MRIALAAIGAVVGILGTAASVRAAPVLQRRGAERAARAGCQRDRCQAGGGGRNRACLLRRARHGRHEGRECGRGTGALRHAAAEDLATALLFLGVGGNAGALVPSANVTDRNSALGKGYTTILTDTAHVGDGTSAQWARLPDGRPDTAKMTDFFHRGAHDVTVAGKAFAAAYYAAKVERSYFDGCSTGGRMALMEAGALPRTMTG